MNTLDDIDVPLLNLLQDDSAATAEALARRVTLSPSAITRRIRRLREDGVIAADVAILSPALTARRKRQLTSSCSWRSAVRSISWPWSSCTTWRRSTPSADRMLAHDPVRRYETSFVKKELKHRPRVVLDERDAV